jgi:hypothetical protein
MLETTKRKGAGCLRALSIYAIVAVLLMVLLYVEEDWRGAHELAAAKQRWQDAGYSLNLTDYFPPSVPDDQNLASLPVFRLEPDPDHPGELSSRQLHEATAGYQHGGALNDYKDTEDLATLVAKAYARMFPGKTPPVSSLAQLEALYPILTELRAAAATHPVFHLQVDYSGQPIWNRSITHLTSPLIAAKLASYDGLLALREKQPQVALDDITLMCEFARGEGTEPSFVGGLIEVGMCTYTHEVLNEGLTRHAWNDEQLAAIQGELKRVDCLALYQFDTRGEVATYSLPRYESCRRGPAAVALMLGWAPNSAKDGVRATLLWCIWASGWWDMNAAQTANLMFRNIQCADPKSRRVDPELSLKLEWEFEKSKVWPGVFAPWNILYASNMGVLVGSVKKFAQGQVRLDEDRIACGLERYRLAHGTYPETLDDLVPACIDELPHDVMNGEPYHYRLNADGTVLLYSVGWNQIDDGGKVGHNKYVPTEIDYETGDWVWPMFRR